MKTILKNGNVLETANGSCRFQPADLVLIDGVIASMVSAGPTEGLKVIDCTGKFIVPGLIDAHNHLSLEPGDECAQMQASDAELALRAAINARADLRSGITAMRTLGDRNYVDLAYREYFNAQKLPGPHLSVSGPGIVATGGVGWYIHQECDGAEEIRRAVRQRSKAGVDTIKVFVTGGVSDAGTAPTRCYFSQNELDVVVEEAHMAGLPTAAHIYGGIGALRAIEAGIDTIEHGFLFDSSMLQAMKAAGTNLVLTPSILDADPSVGPLWRQERLRAIQASYPRVIREALQLGIPIAVGSDCNHTPYFFVQQLLLLQKFGLNPEQILYAATAAGAEIAGFGDRGVIAPKQRADLLILDSDPLEDIANLMSMADIICGAAFVTPHPHPQLETKGSDDGRGDLG